MNTLRKFIVVIATSLLPVFLFSFGLTFSLFQVFGSPDHIKAALNKSETYDSFLSEVLSDVKVEEGQQQGIPVNRPEVQKIIQNAASPDMLQTQTEGFLDSMYVWMRGESKQLQLEINLTDAKAKLTEGMTQYASDRLVSLPACGSEISAESFDALNAECLPKGVDATAAIEKVRAEIATGEFLKDPVITEDTIKDDQGKPLEERLKAVPGVYRLIVIDLWVSGILAVLFTIIILVFYKPWRAGLKRIGFVFVAVGATAAVMAWAAGLLTQKLVDALNKSGEGEVQARLAEIVNILTKDVRSWWLGYGLIILGLGIAAFVTLKCIKSPAAPASTGTAHKNVPLKKEDSPEDKLPPTVTKTV